MAGRNEDRRQVMIPPPMWDQITVLAKHDTTSASAIVRIGMREYIDRRLKEAKKKKRESQGGKMSMQQALDAAE